MVYRHHCTTVHRRTLERLSHTTGIMAPNHTNAWSQARALIRRFYNTSTHILQDERLELGVMVIEQRQVFQPIRTIDYPRNRKKN